MSRIAVIPGLDPASYQRSTLHAEDRIWLEKNCYVDIWIALLQALHLEPRAMLGFTMAVDFEGDQWTFFKPKHEELRELYGIDVQELNVWRPLLDHAVEHLSAGKFISTEADAFWLPDTAGTDYRRQHVKSTIVLADIDVDGQRLGYFHNAGYYALEGEDFVQTFRVGFPPDPAFLPLFAELVRIDGLVRRTEAELAEIALRLLRQWVRRRPAYNPITRFRERLERDVPALLKAGLPYYHAWAFGTVRQLGAASELAKLHLVWLGSLTAYDLASPAEAFSDIASATKLLILKLARAVNCGRPPQLEALFCEMENHLDDALRELQLALGVGNT
ncbi:MAG: DUF1839 family protein [Pseudomonadota bacterium]